MLQVSTECLVESLLTSGTSDEDASMDECLFLRLLCFPCSCVMKKIENKGLTRRFELRVCEKKDVSGSCHIFLTLLL